MKYFYEEKTKINGKDLKDNKLSAINGQIALDNKLKNIMNYDKEFIEKKDKEIPELMNGNNKNQIKEKVDPFDFDFMLKKNPVVREKNIINSGLNKKNDFSDLINYQDSEININNFDYLNLKNYNHEKNQKTSPNKVLISDVSKIDNITSTPDISQKQQINQLLNLKNINSYNKPASALNSNISRENIKPKNSIINNIAVGKKYSRPESAKVPTSIKVSNKILDNPSNKRISPIKNLNIPIDYKNQKNVNNFNINEYINKNKGRNLTPLKPIEGYKSPILNNNIDLNKNYMKKNIIPSLNNVPIHPTPVRIRPLSGINPSIAKINQYNNYNKNLNVKSSLINKNYNRNEVVNTPNKRNFTPTPSNMKSNRIELDANKRNYGNPLGKNVIDNKYKADNYNKISNIYSNRKNINDKNKLLDKINMNNITKSPLPSKKIGNNKIEHDYNNFYNQGKILKNNYDIKIQNANIIKKSNNDYINNIYSNFYNPIENNIQNFARPNQENRLYSGRK